MSLHSLDAAVNAFFASFGEPGEAVARLALALLFGGVVGLEREIRVKHAGFRTLILVCMGSALVMLVSTQLAYTRWPDPPPGTTIQIDPGRIAYGIMTGIGFLGAGTIIQRRTHAAGLTTAAAIWCTAAIGMALGLGLYTLATVTTLLTLAALWLLDYAESLIPRRRTRELTVRTRYRPAVVPDTIDRFRKAGPPRLTVLSAGMERSDDLALCDITLHVAYNDVAAYHAFESSLDPAGEFQVVRSRDV